jgi:hypothetical protein
MGLVLIHPPVSKPSEPPAGLARLAGTLKQHGIDYTLIDANLEALLDLGLVVPKSEDTWTRRAFRHYERNLGLFTQWGTYANHARYSRAVADTNRALESAGRPTGATVSLVDYQDAELTPVRSQDLLRAADRPAMNVFYPYFRDRIVKTLSEIKPDLVGISLNYMSQALCTFALIGLIKQSCPQTRIVLGGSLITSWMSSPDWQNPFGALVDELVSGPGEERLVRLAGKEPATQPALPDYAALMGAPYLAPGLILPYSTSTGCYWNRCTFCPERAEKTCHSARPPRQAIQELETLIDQTDPILIHLCDNALSPALLTALAEHPLPVPWYGFARVGPPLTDPEFCQAIKRSGCVMLQLGLESGDPAVLESLNKGIVLSDISRSLANLKMAGIATYA